MRNLFKKSLAIVVALALCLTALVGAVTVNAETKTGTITSEVTVGEATVDVVFTITTDGLNEAIFSYDYDEALGVPTTIKSVNNNLEVVTAETGNLFELRDTSDNGLTDVTVGEVKFTFNKPADGTYNVTLSVHSAGASGTEEILIDMAPCTATIEIAPAHEHNYAAEWSHNETNHWHACLNEGCDGTVADTAAHTYGDPEITYTDCTSDGNAKYTCTVCGYYYERATDPKGHTPVSADNAVPATCGTAGKESDTVCKDCRAVLEEGAVIPATGEHNYENDSCTVCGVSAPEPAVDENITITPSLNVSQTINIRFLMGSIPACNDFYVEIHHDKFGGDYNFIEGGYTEKIYKSSMTSASNNRYYFVYNKLALAELSIPVEATLYCLDEKGNTIYKSTKVSNTLASMTKSAFNKSSSSIVKTLYSDIIEIASVAQTHFAGGKDNDLAKLELPNADFTGTPTGSIDTSLLNKTNEPISHDGKVSITPSINLPGRPAIRFLVSGANNYDINDLKLVIEYDSPVATVEPEVYDFTSLSTASNNRYYHIYTGLALCDGNQTVTAKIYNGEISEVNLISEVSYSIEYTIANTSSSSSAYDLYTQIAKLGISARAYFIK